MDCLYVALLSFWGSASSSACCCKTSFWLCTGYQIRTVEKVKPIPLLSFHNSLVPSQQIAKQKKTELWGGLQNGCWCIAALCWSVAVPQVVSEQRQSLERDPWEIEAQRQEQTWPRAPNQLWTEQSLESETPYSSLFLEGKKWGLESHLPWFHSARLSGAFLGDLTRIFLSCLPSPSNLLGLPAVFFIPL